MPLPINMRMGLGNKPTPTMINFLVADGRCYSAPSNMLAIPANATAANQTAACALWNPAASGVQLWVYAIHISSDTAGVKVRLQHIVADPALGTAVTPINLFRQAVLATSAALVETSVAAGLAIPSTNLTHTYISGIVPILIQSNDTASTWLNPGTGIYVSLNEETANTAVNVACLFEWAEFSTS